MICSLIFDRFLVDKSIKNRSKKRSKIRCDFGWILEGSWSDLGSILGSSWEPSWGQVGTKSLQKSIQKVIQKIITFWIALGRDFDRFWSQLGGLGGAKDLTFRTSCWCLGASWGQDAPQTPPRPSKRAPGIDFGRFWHPTLWIF